MNKGGAPKGNNNAGKARSWAEAIDKALKQSKDGMPQKLRALADKIIDMALDGDMAAMKEIGDRVDGKALAHVHVTGDLGLGDMTNQQLDTRLQELHNGIRESEQGSEDRVH